MISDCSARKEIFMPENKYHEELETIRRKTDDVYRSAEGMFGFSKGVMMIIWTLSAFKRPCTQKEICDDWCESKQTINSAAKKLIEDGIIDIAPSPDNFREKLLTFTEKGRFLAMRTAGKLIEADNNAFERLTEEEQKEMVRLNRRYYEFLKEEFEKIEGEKQ